MLEKRPKGKEIKDNKKDQNKLLDQRHHFTRLKQHSNRAQLIRKRRKKINVVYKPTISKASCSQDWQNLENSKFLILWACPVTKQQKTNITSIIRQYVMYTVSGHV